MNAGRAPSRHRHQRLTDGIRRQIERNGPLSFGRFMERVLYDEQDGYYSAGPEVLGTGGDYFTASDAGRELGRCLARQIAEVDRLAGPWDPFRVVELGAGRGLLARDVLDASRGSHLEGRLRYTMVDRSAAMREAAACEASGTLVVAPDDAPRGGNGVAIAVELFDALPVHRLRRKNGRLLEIGVALGSDGGLIECELEPLPEVRALAERYGAAAQEGFEAEVAPAASEMLKNMVELLDAGVLFIVDYGDRAEALYGPRRPRGTLLAYHGHGTNEAYLERLGEQDLTAHVNFSLLEDRARELGLDVLGWTTQDRFLIENGILEVFEDQPLEALQDPRRAKRRLQAMQLIHPEGMGRAFKVLVLSKGLSPPPDLSGLRDPFAR